MPTKINVVLDDDVKAELDRLVESGLRSRLINEALRKELVRVHRRRVTEMLEELRARTRPVRTSDVVALLRRDRRSR